MTPAATPPSVLDRDFLAIRHRLIDVGAMLDRVDRAAGPSAAGDPRLDQIRDAITALADGQSDRAARVQMIFSDVYDPAWRG